MKRHCLLLAGFLAAAHANAKTPNILFIHMEDMGPFFAAYGDTTAHTPRLDRLASEGLVFNRACVTAATCAASRGSLFTGLYPHQNGIMGFVKTHGFRYREGVPTYVQRLHDAGYYTGITYKTGIEPDSTVPFDHKYSWRTNRITPDDNQNEIKNGIDNFRHFLQTCPKDRPFYFQSQNSDTHSPWVGPKCDEHFFIKGLPGADIYKPIDPKTVKSLPHFGPDFDMNFKVRKFLAGYYEATQRVDYFVGCILDLLEESGEADNTLVVFSADHGPSHLSRGKTTAYEFGLHVPFIVRWPGKTAKAKHSDALVSFVDLMPTFLDVAGLDIPSYLPGQSLVPVFTGENPPGARKYIYSAYVAHTTGYFLYWPTRTINDGRYKLILNVNGDGATRRDLWMGAGAKAKGTVNDNCVQVVRDAISASGERVRQAYARSLTPPKYELYDLQEDPGEIENLTGRKDNAQIEEKLRSELLRWRRDVVADPFLDPVYVKAFNEDYAKKTAFYRKHVKKETVVEGVSRLNKWGGWQLDMSRWIPAWDPAPYKPEL